MNTVKIVKFCLLRYLLEGEASYSICMVIVNTNFTNTLILNLRNISLVMNSLNDYWS